MSEFPAKVICFFNSNKAWGGGEKWHFSTAREFIRRGFKTFLVTNPGSALARKCTEAQLPFLPVRITNLSFLNPYKIYKLYSYFRQQQTDVVIMNLSSDVKAGSIAAKLAGVKKIMYRRGLPHPLRDTLLNRFIYQRVLTHVIVNSEEVGRSFTTNNETWFPAHKLFLLNNGVDINQHTEASHKLYQKQGSEIIIGNAGRLTAQKGQEYLIQMAQVLKARQVNFKLLIAGEGKLKQPLTELIRQQNLENEITLLGHVEDMAGFLNSLDVFVFPSLFEGSANTLIEVLHQGIPSVAFNISSNPEIIEHGKTGFLATPFSAEEMAAYVMQLTTDAAFRQEIVQNGKQLIREKFDIRKNLDRLQALISS
ncbi:glycosyltransferase [Adhaeribacter soli]|nr:glycosyltransferase [Adhaeribacter soli]